MIKKSATLTENFVIFVRVIIAMDKTTSTVKISTILDNKFFCCNSVHCGKHFYEYKKFGALNKDTNKMGFTSNYFFFLQLK